MKPNPDVADHVVRILIVDDERHNRQLLEVMLKPEGFELSTAASGEEALAMVATQPPDLILLDVMMPGMDGYRVASRLKSSLDTKNIPIIMVTALDDRNARMLGLSAGAEDLLTKPVDRAELCVRVRNLLRLKAYGDYYDTYSQMLEGEVSARTANLVEHTEALERQANVLTSQAALLDLAQDAIIVRDIDNHILFWSRGAEAMYGWTRQEAIGRVTHELLKAEFSEPLERIQAVLVREGRWEGEVTQCTRDGTRVIVASRWALQCDAAGAPVHVLAINTDITARKRGEAELQAQTQRLSLATAVAKIGVWEWDLASNTLAWDATMFEIYGVPPVAPVPYHTWSAAVCPDDLPHVQAAMQKGIAEKSEALVEYRIVTPDGAVRTISSVERAVLDEQGNVARLIGVNMDITERKEEAAALDQSRQDQLRFKDDFLSHVSHELRSPLTAIKQFTTILLAGLAGELNDKQRQYQEIVLKNIRQLQSMIDDLLEVTRLETGKLTVEPRSLSVSDAVTDTLNTLEGSARSKRITLSFDLPSDLPPAFADHTRLRQILIILLDNAIKFTPDAGAVHIRARPLPLDPRFLLLEVSDTGCGISPEIAEKVFDRLYQVSEPTQTSRRGLGLGLYICKELVARQGGTIWVTPSLPAGTVFSFTLPVFSLSSLLAPFLTNGKWPADSIALVTVRMRLRRAWASPESRQAWSQEARSILQRCLLPDLDVLLPTPSAVAEGERFFLAAFVDELGAAALAGRIRQQFDRLPQLNQTGLTLSVSHTMLPPVPREARASASHVVERMAGRLEDAIQSHILSEAPPS